VAWQVDGVEEVSFQSSFEGVQGARIADGSRYILFQVAGALTIKKCRWIP